MRHVAGRVYVRGDELGGFVLGPVRVPAGDSASLPVSLGLCVPRELAEAVAGGGYAVVEVRGSAWAEVRLLPGAGPSRYAEVPFSARCLVPVGGGPVSCLVAG